METYYPCDICGHNHPGNVVRKNKSGQTVAYCSRHNMLDIDEKQGVKDVKKKEKFLDEFRKAFVNVDYE